MNMLLEIMASGMKGGNRFLPKDCTKIRHFQDRRNEIMDVWDCEWHCSRIVLGMLMTHRVEEV